MINEDGNTVDEKGVELKWWLTSQRLWILGMTAEPFVMVVFLPMFPFPFYVKLLGWFLLINMVVSWVFRKNLITIFLYMRNSLLNNRRHIYSARKSLRKFYG